MKIGIPTHLVKLIGGKSGKHLSTACGTYGTAWLSTENLAEVNCLNCMRTKKYKEAKANAQNS